MKKILFFSAIIVLALLTVRLTASSGGSKYNFTGAPGDQKSGAGSVQDGCASGSCHADFGCTPGTNVTLTGLPASYTPGSTYSLTLSLNKNQANTGFAFVCKTNGFTTGVSSDAFKNAGTFVVTDAVNTALTANHMAHTTAGLQVGAASPVSYSFNWVAPMAGSGQVKFYSAMIRGNNAGGNAGDYTYTNRWVLNEALSDSVKPSRPVLIAPGMGKLTNDSTPGLLWRKSVDASGIQKYVVTVIAATNGTTLTNYNWPSALADGVYGWWVYSVDNANNIGTNSRTNILTIDTTRPATPVRVTLVSNEVTNDSTPYFLWNKSTDANGIRAYLLQVNAKITNVGLLTNLNWPVAIADGAANTWRVRAIDNAGNTNTAGSLWSFTIDTAGPAAPTIIAPLAGASVTNQRPTLVWNKAVDATSGIREYRVSPVAGTTNIVTAPTTNWTPGVNQAEGSYTWWVQAVDNAGNRGIGSSRIFTIDRSGPNAPALASPADLLLTRSASPTLVWNKATDTFSAISSYKIAAPQGTTNTVASPTTNLSTEVFVEGTNRWQVQAVDAAGNRGTWSAVRRVIVDTTPPVTGTRITLSSNEMTNDSTPNFIWNKASDLNGISAYLLQVNAKYTNVGLLTNLAWPIVIPDGTGYFWRLRVVDTAGNTNAVSSAWSFAIDTSGPSAPAPVSPAAAAVMTNQKPLFVWNKSSDAVSGVKEYRVVISAGTTNIVAAPTTNYTPGANLAEGTYNWQVQAVDNAGNRGGWGGPRILTVDRSGPSAPALSSPADLLLTRSASPALVWNTATDTLSAIFSYKIAAPQGTTNTVASPTTNLSTEVFVEGTNRWQVQAVDTAGNRGSWSAVRRVILDTTPPVSGTRITLTSNSFTNDNTPRFSWNPATDANGVGAYILQVNAKVTNVGALTSLIWPVALADAVGQTWRLRAIDNAGNTNAWSSLWTFTVDAGGPSAPALSSPAAAAVMTNQKPLFVWNKSTDAVSGVKEYRVVISAGTTNVVAAPTTNYTPGANLAEGTYNWQVQAVDNAGNRGGWGGPRILTVDRSGPSAPALSSPADLLLTRSASPALVWNMATDTLSAIFSYKIAAPQGTTNTVASPTTNLSTEVFVEGTNRWQVQAVDLAGNRGSWSAVRRVILDTTPPVSGTRITLTSNSFTNDNTPRFSWNPATDANGVGAYILQVNAKVTNVGALTSLIWPVALADAVGQTWRLRAIDNAGNTNAWSSLWTFTVDAGGPSAPALSTPAAAAVMTNQKPLFVWNKSSDAVSGVKEYRVVISAGTTNVVAAPTTNYTPGANLAEGTYNWQVQAVDNAGNRGVWGGPRILTVDRSGPSAPALSSPADLLLMRSVSPTLVWNTATDTLSAISSYKIAAPQGTTNTVASPTTNLSTEVFVEGTNRWQVQAVDLAGNRGTWSAIRRVILDTTPPVSGTRITLKSNAVTNDNTPFFSWNAGTDLNGVSGYVLQVNAKATNVGLLTGLNWPAALADGAGQTWRLRTIDNAGNTNAWSSSWTFAVDTTPPGLVSLLSPASNSYVSTTNQVLSWNAAVDATTAVKLYIVTIDDKPAFPSPQTIVTNSLSWSVIGLARNTTNYWKIRAVDTAGNTNGWSPAWRFIIDTSQIIPTLLSPDNGVSTNNNNPVYSWSDESGNGAGRYRIEVRTNLSTATKVVASNTNVLTSSVSLSALPQHVYYWRVRAWKTVGGIWQTYSGIFSFTVDTNKPTAPALVLPSNLKLTNDATPYFLWNKSADNNSVAGYRFVVGTATNLLSATNYTPGGNLPDGTNTWSVSSYDQAHNKSAWNSRKVIVDTTPPSTPSLSSPASNTLTRNGTQTVSWSAAADLNGILRYEVQIDGGAISNAGAALNDSIIFTPGTHIWRVHAIDNAGNAGSWSSAWTIIVDTTAPAVVTLATPASNTVQATAPVTLTWNASSDANGVAGYIAQIATVKTFAGAVTKVTNGLSWATSLSAGTNWWRVKAYDNAGNTNNTWSAAWTAVLDTAQVVPTLLAPQNGTLTNVGNPLYKWTDESATASKYWIEVRTNNLSGRVVQSNANISTATPSYQFGAALADGRYAWHVRAQKTSTGLWNSWSASNRLTVDTTPPSTPSLSSPASNTLTQNGTQTVSWSAAADLNGILRYEVQIDGGAISNAGAALNDSIVFTPGTHIWRVHAIDNAGNAGSWSSAWTIIVDTTAPAVVTLATPASNTVQATAPVTLTWNASSDANGVAGYIAQIATVKTFAGAVTKVTNGLSWATSLSAGTNWWRVKAYDNAGNTNNTWSAAWTAVLDTAQVVPTLLAPQNGTLTNVGNPLYKWTDESATASKYWIEVRTNNLSGRVVQSNANISTATPSYQFGAALADGRYAWHVRAQKTSTGLWNSWSASNRLTVDTTPPSTPSLSSPASNTLTRNGTQTLSWSAAADLNGILRYEVQIDGGAISNAGAALNDSIVFTPGTHTWRVHAIDNAGNAGSWSSAWTIIVDTTAPAVVALATPASNTVQATAPVTLTWNASSDANGVAGYIAQIATTKVFAAPVTKVTNGLSWSTSLSAGTNWWRVKAYDNAGNTNNTWSAAWTAVLDTAQVVPTLLAPQNGTVTNHDTPYFIWSDESSQASKYWLEIRTNNLSGRLILSNNNISTAVPAFEFGTPIADGRYVWRVRAKKTSTGIWNAWSSSNNLVMDTVAPTIPAPSSPASNTLTRNGAQTVSWSAAADLNGILRYEVQIDGGAISNAGAALNQGIVFTPGAHTWRVHAIDNAGNAGSWSPVWTIIVDTTAPAVVALATPASNSIQGSAPATLAWNASSDANGVGGYIVQFDDNTGFASPAVYVQAGTSVAVTLLSGTNWWRVKAYDNAGNTNSSWSPAWRVVFDTNNIVPVLTAPANGTITNQPQPPLYWSDLTGESLYWIEIRQDSTSGSLVYSNAAIAADMTSDTPTSSLPDGRYAWRVRAYKTATSLWQPWSASNLLIIDTVGPAVPSSLTPASNASTTNRQPTFTWSAPADLNGISSYEIEIDSAVSTVTGTSFTPGSQLPVASHAWRVRGIDTAGNPGIWSSLYSLTVTAPVVSSGPAITAVTPGSVYADEAVTLVISGSNLAGPVWVFVGPRSLTAVLHGTTNITAELPAGLAPGSYSLTVVSAGATNILASAITIQPRIDDVFKVIDNVIDPTANEEAVFSFDLTGLTASSVRLTIYTILGQVVTDIEEPVSSDFFQVRWNGRNKSDRVIASGVYLVKAVIAGKEYLSQVFIVK